MLAAVIQMCSTTEIERNLRVARAQMVKAAKQGAQLCVLPEMFAQYGPHELCIKAAQTLDSELSSWASDLAKELGIFLVAGSMLQKLPQSSKCANTSLIFGPNGELLQTYQKIHLFDCQVPGAVYQESKHIQAGNDISTCPLNDTACLGLSICYDLRFPELFRLLALKGANLVALPAAFTEKTGRDHWEILIRARAIENQIFVLASNQTGSPGKSLARYGHSMIVDPWGKILAQITEGEGFAMARLDFKQQQSIRQLLPSLLMRRPQAYQ